MTTKHQDGMSLVELMISMTIGLIIVTATFNVYLENRQISRSSEVLARMQENARLAMELMGRDIKLAGYYGLTSSSAWLGGIKGSSNALSAMTAGTDCEDSWYIDLIVPIWAINDTNPFDETCIPEDSIGTELKTNTDLLLVRHASTQTLSTTAKVDDLSAAEKTALEGKLLIRTSPSAGMLFTNPNSPPSGFTGKVEDREMITHLYYIRPYFQDTDDDLPTLVYENLQDGGSSPALSATDLVPGVEEFQIQLGIDDDKDGTVDFYRDPEAVSVPGSIDPDTISAVRMWLLMRAEDPEFDINDTTTYTLGSRSFTPSGPEVNYRRLLFTATVKIRNDIDD